MPSKLSIALIASLAINAALLGVVGGRVLSPKPKPEPTAQQMQFERYGPTSDVVARAWDQLPEADRKVLRTELRERWKALEGERHRLAEAGKAVYDTAKADPFDEARLRDAVTIFQTREQRMQQSAEDILIRHLGSMPPDARATAAVGLLTPFNARIQRVDRKEGDGPRAPGLPSEAPKPAQPTN